MKAFHVKLRDILYYLLHMGFTFFPGLIIHLPFSHLIVKSLKCLSRHLSLKKLFGDSNAS